MQIGIGTYSFGGIASFLGLGPTLLEKFHTAAALGYDSIELLAVDLESNSTEDIKAWLAETGLTVTSVHAEPTEEIVRKMAALGGGVVIWPSTAIGSAAEAREVAEILDGMAKMAAPYGVKVAYHNHSSEFFFDEGKTLLEHMLDHRDTFYAQLDCGWAQNGGMYPPNFIRKYRDRIIAIHVKENSRVVGPGERPRSRHAEVAGGGKNPLAALRDLPLEERKKALESMAARSGAGDSRFDVQCKMGAPESNIDWCEVKRALDEQSFEAFWVVEREGFYDEHDKCLAEDCAWLRENIK